MSYRRAWDGHEWQRYALQLVQLRHGHQHVQAVPDQLGGDAGLEFTCLDKDGGKGAVTYQCYLRREPVGCCWGVCKERKPSIGSRSSLRQYVHNLGAV